MKRTLCWLLIATPIGLCLFWSVTAPVHSQEAPKAEASKPNVVKVETGKIVLDVSLKGTIESEQTAELFLEAKAWAQPYVVKSAVAHGTRVKKGDIVAEFDTVKIDQSLNDMRVDRELADIALRLAKDDLPLQEQSLPLSLASADRDKRIAEEDFKRYQDIEREQQKKSAEFQLKSQMQWLEYAREELKQLQKMYRDKDLTEETEEIILKRQRNQIEQLEFGLETLKLHQEREEILDRPRRDQNMKDGLEKSALAWKRAKTSLPLDLNHKRLALQKQETEHGRAEERFQQMEGDRAAMIARAPMDGIVYHGQADRGQWNSANVTGRLRRNGTIQPHEVFMTVVSTRPAMIRTDVEEKDLNDVKVGLTGQAIPVGFPSVKLVAGLKSVSLVPRVAGNFEARITLDIPDNVETVLPGMTANVKFVTYRKDNAVLVPTSAIFHDEGSETPYVYVWSENKSVKTEIETGKVSGAKTEILSGLKVGVEILASKP